MGRRTFGKKANVYVQKRGRDARNTIAYYPGNEPVFLAYKGIGGGSNEYRFFPKKSKPIIDEIDKVLAQHYGFTDEELDFIINYDIKYRMGDELTES